MKYTLILLCAFCLIGCVENHIKEDRKAPIISSEISSANINCVAEDAQGFLWFGTIRGLNRYNGTNFHQYIHSEEDSLSISQNIVSCLFLDSKNRFWVGTSAGVGLLSDQETFLKFDGLKGRYGVKGIVEDSQGTIFTSAPSSIFYFNEQKQQFIKLPETLTSRNYDNDYLLLDSRDHLWWGSQNKVFVFDSQSRKMVDSLTLTIDVKSAVLDKKHDEAWLCSNNDILIYDMHTRMPRPLPSALQTLVKVKSSHIYSLYFLRNGDMLISTSQGVYYYFRERNKVVSQENAEFPLEKPKFSVNAFYEDRAQNIWYLSSKQGFQLCRKQQGLFSSEPKLVDALKDKNIVSIAPGGDDRIWFYSLPDELYLYHSKVKQLDRIALNHISYDISLNTTPLLYEDKEGYLWLGVSDSLMLKCSYENKGLKTNQSYRILSSNSISGNRGGDKIYVGQYSLSSSLSVISGSMVKNIDLNKLFATSIIPLSDGRMAVAMIRDGLMFIEDEKTTYSTLTGAHLNSILNQNIDFHVISMLEDTNQCIWMGTLGNGLLCYDQKTGLGSSVEGLRKDNIFSIQEDENGFLWLGTDNGLVQYDKSSKHVKKYYKEDGITCNQFGVKSSAKMLDGTLLFGGIQGLTAIDSNYKTKEDSIPIFFEDLFVFNDLVTPSSHGTIAQRMVLKPEINLNHNQTGFTISFSHLNLGGTSQYTYQYMLEGVDKYWVNAPISQSASYANVEPGRYTFKVRLMSNDMKTVKGESEIQVHIHPAPWNTWWAHLLYALFVTLVLFIITRVYLNMKKEHDRAEQERQEKERELHVNQMNMNFFANVSHEFRTPLTVISGPLSQLSDDEFIPEKDRSLLRIINRSVNRMLLLVNQMMDFNKLEDDALKLQVCHQDIVPLLKEQLAFFKLYAQEKEIQLTSRGLDDYFLSWIDEDKVEKILNNLLGNAMKYSPAGSSVCLVMDTLNREDAIRLFSIQSDDVASQYVQISVIDNGNGIPDEQKKKIFDRFYQLDNQQKGQFSWGTGIGLYYVKRLVELHHGFIKVMDNPDGKGACFSFVIPVSSSAYVDSEKMQLVEKQRDRYPLLEVGETSANLSSSPSSNATQQSKPRLLIVDDDVEIIHYMKILLAEDYDVVCRFDAETAYKTLQEAENFDLIISDLMMPGTNGIQFCSQIKADEQHCHIPFILITAKNNVQEQIEGIKAGAIAYLFKPFDPAYLKALINTLLTNKGKTQEQLVKSTQTAQVEEDALTAQDKAFMNELYKLMEEELSNPDLDISRVTELLRVSRSKLYYKIKGLTGENPGTFFRHYKLNRAAEMIREGKYNITEISMLTGYNTVQHFSASFKKQFGCTPSDYK